MTTVNNMHIRFIADKLSRFAYEVIKSQSSNLSTYLGSDAVRLKSYLDAIDTAHKWVVGLPEMDLPETTPHEYEVEDFPEVVDADNEAVNMLQDLLHAAYTEITKAQSARMGAGLTTHDSQRLTNTIVHARKFLEEYVLAVTPLDQPESSPMEKHTGKGR